MKMPKRSGVRAKQKRRADNLISEDVWKPVSESIADMIGGIGEMKNGIVDLKRYKDTDEQPGIEDDVLHMEDDINIMAEDLKTLCDRLDEIVEYLRGEK
jgi:hypothetical protein